MAWAVLLCFCSWWRWCRGSRLWSLFLFSFLSLLLLSVFVTLFLSKQFSVPLSRFPLLFLFFYSFSVFSFSFFLPPSSAPSPRVFIGKGGEVHHTLYKHRAWWPGHGSSAFRHGGGHGSPVSPLMRVWVV